MQVLAMLVTADRMNFIDHYFLDCTMLIVLSFCLQSPSLKQAEYEVSNTLLGGISGTSVQMTLLFLVKWSFDSAHCSTLNIIGLKNCYNSSGEEISSWLMIILPLMPPVTKLLRARNGFGSWLNENKSERKLKNALLILETAIWGVHNVRRKGDWPYAVHVYTSMQMANACIEIFLLWSLTLPRCFLPVHGKLAACSPAPQMNDRGLGTHEVTRFGESQILNIPFLSS